ncbi:MAG: hypothetical protein ABEJ26_08825 [Halosimplex sp.]
MKASTGDADGQRDRLSALFDALADADRRTILSRLREAAPDPVGRDALATTLAGAGPDGSSDGDRKGALIALSHRHLPKLEDAGLVTREGDAVALASHPAFEDPGVGAVVDGDASVEASSLDALFRALANGRRRAVLDALSHQHRSVHLETLARDLAADEPASAPDAFPSDVDAVAAALHHRHLPVLRRADLVEYDAEAETVGYRGHPELRVSWTHSEFGQDFVAGLTDSPTDAEVWKLEGRETVVSCGQTLFERAEDELFLLFTETGLLEAGCMSRVRQAAERGVDVYLGTADPTVREFVREEAPGVTLWEPETNWLDLPVDERNVGRLVFADREAVMIGTLGERTDGGEHRERAIFGANADNTLVVLVRQLLGSQFGTVEATADAAEAELSL